MAAWRLARSLETLRAQINARYPKRSKVSDGTIGDQAHAVRNSDHNPVQGVVCAFDITNDSNYGPDLAKLIPELLKDRRTKYVIFNKKIYNPTIENGKARPYTGANAHQKHLHISVLFDRKDEAQDWVLAPSGSAPAPVPPAPVPVRTSVVKRGMTGGDVPALQMLLRNLGWYKGLVDGSFGPQTETAVKAFQKSVSGLKADGIVGPKTWQALSVALPVATDPSKEQKVYDPQVAVKYFTTLGWGPLQAVALTANLMWESGGNTKKPQTIVFNAHGDKDKDGIYRSHGAGQWNEKVGRYDKLLNFARERGKPWNDAETQLLFLDHELHTPPYSKVGTELRATTTLEDAVTTSIKLWAPSIPHADRRLAIAKALLDA